MQAMGEVRSIYPDDEELEGATCEVCGKEEPANQHENWIYFSDGNDGHVGVDVCDECAKSDEKLKEAFDVFVSEYRRPFAD